MSRWLAVFLALLQAALGVRVAWRLLRTGGEPPIRAVAPGAVASGSIAVLAPVLDEAERVGDCLAGLLAQGPEVGEVLVIDGGSHDGTAEVVRAYARRDERVRLIEAGAAPSDWNGKVWNLHVGEGALAEQYEWLLIVDADVRLEPALARSPLARARSRRLHLLSVATGQCLSNAIDGVLHPGLLATLVYRYGRPGGATDRPGGVLANGQCCLIQRELLAAVGGFQALRDSLCEDVTLARLAAGLGDGVGFYEADGLVHARMYVDWRAAWRNWPRSLTTRDRLFGVSGWVGLLEVLATQALPLPLLALAWRSRLLRRLNLLLLGMRLGILVGMARAYPARPWTYWLSPLADLPAACALWRSALARRHTWRGRSYSRANGSIARS